MKRKKVLLSEPKITEMPIPEIPHWAHSQDNTTCYYVEHVKHPTKGTAIGLCECGQHWTNEGGTLKAITRLKYQTVSTEIAELEEAEKLEAQRRAENILGPNISDAMYPWKQERPLYHAGQRGYVETDSDMEAAYQEAKAQRVARMNPDDYLPDDYLKA